MQEIRCCNCCKKLAEGDYLRLDIKCPRCKVVNRLSVMNTELERQGASIRTGKNDKSNRSLDGRQAPLSR